MEKNSEQLKALGKAAELQKHLTKDLPIDELEKFESEYKKVLKTIFSEKVGGETARKLAKIQKNIGLIFKYKSYTVKASNPLGYSIFFHNQGEGFSFQQHISHKTEVFHILKKESGGFVFICSYDDWKKIYDPDSFAEWLSGKPDARYDQFKYEPKAGDVFVLDQLGIVHTVVGCTLEEFATVSTDMVDKLHDQNEGKKIPENFVREYSQNRIQSIEAPLKSRIVEIVSGRHRITEIKPIKINGGLKIELASMNFAANRYVIEKNGRTDFQKDDECAISLCVTGGKGSLIMGDDGEIQDGIFSEIPIYLGDNVIIPPGIYYSFANKGNSALDISEQKIPYEIGLIG